MKKLFLLLALFSLLCVGCSDPNDPIDTPQDPTEQPGNDTGNGDEGNEDENGGNNDENEGNGGENKTFITDAEGNIIVNAEGGDVVVTVTTNIEYDVAIPEDAQAWLSVADTRGELRMEKLTFTVAENEAEEERSAVVTLLDGENLELQSITFTQKGAIVDSTQAIKFQDENTKLICTLHWDENEDGELSYEEAAKVTDLGTAFKGSSIMAFTELEHFTALDGITDNNFYGCVSLVKITLPEQITSIGKSSFYGCSNLKKITIPDSVTSIGEVAFAGCSSLTSVTIGDGVTSIGYSAFYDCSSLTSITIPDSVISIGDFAFEDCSSLTSVTIGSGVTSIGDYAFRGCSSLTSITIPDSVTSIGEKAFSGCTGELIVNCNIPSSSFDNSKFTKVTIGDSVTSIGSSAFYECSDLTSVTIPDSVTSIGSSAFEYCSGLTSVYYNGDLSDWCNIVFYSNTSNPLHYGAKLYINNTEVTEITIPSDISVIKDYTFYGCSSLTSITIPDSVTSIGSYAFSGCTGELIVNCNIPSASSSSSGAFYNSKFTKVTIGDGVTKIGDYAFYDCSSLTSVTIPDSVTSIGEEAFYGCTGELIVNCNIPSDAFANSKFTKVTIGDGVTSIGESVFLNCGNLKEFRGKFASEDKKCLIVNNEIVAFAPSEITEYTIPSNVISIGSYTFYNCSCLTSVTIPECITSIGEYAFFDCRNLKSVYCKPTTPPSGNRNMFGNNATNREIYVPIASKEAYMSAEDWDYYGSSSIVGYDFEIGVSEYDFKIDASVLAFVDRGYFRALDIAEIPGCDLFNGDWYDDKIILPFEYQVNATIQGFQVSCYDWTNRTDEHNDTQYVKSLVWYMNEYGNAAQKSYFVLDNNRSYTLVALLIDCNGQKYFSKTKIETSYDCINTNISVFETFWEENL